MNQELSQKPLISVVVPARNAEELLPGLLESVFRTQWKDFECIVIDDASTDGSLDSIKRFPVKTIALKEKVGPAEARNIGGREANGKYLLFIDADVVLSEDTIDIIGRRLTENPSLVGINSYCKPEPLNDSPVARYAARFEHHFFHNFLGDSDSKFIPALSTRCGAIRKDVFFELGGLNARLFASPSAEDTEFAYRLAGAERKLMLVKGLLVEHRWPDSLAKLSKRYFRNARIFMALVRIHGEFSVLWMTKFEGILRVGAFAMICALGASVFYPPLIYFALAYAIFYISYNRKLYFSFLKDEGFLPAGRAVLLHIGSSIPICLGALYGKLLYGFTDPKNIQDI